MGKRAGPLSEISAQSAEISASIIFPYEQSVPPTGMKNVEMRMRRRNYVNDFSNFQVNISINVKFHPGRRDENNHMNAREIYPSSVTGIPARECAVRQILRVTGYANYYSILRLCAHGVVFVAFSFVF